MKNIKPYIYLSVIVVFVIVSVVITNVRADNDNISVNDGGTVNVYNQSTDEESGLGGSTSDDWNVGGDLTVSGETKIGDLIQGGGSLVITGTTTLTAAQVCSYSIIEQDPQQAAGITLTLPATSTLYADCFDTVGNSKTVLLYNSADGAEDITVVAGTGIDLQESDGQNVVIGQHNYASLTFTRLSDTTGETYVSVTETIPAD